MKPIIELLKEMRGRLPMYVGSNSIIKMAAFLRGFSFALEKHGFGQDDRFLSAFQELVQTRYSVRISKGWEDIILFQSCDDDEAMDTFWRLFDDFCQTGSGTKE